MSDVSGKNIFTQNVSEKNASLDFSALPPGVYLLKISSGKNFTVRKIVKTGS
jgi:hypothetical protein